MLGKSKVFWFSALLSLSVFGLGAGEPAVGGQTSATQGTVTVIVLDTTGGVIQDAQLELRDISTNDIRKATTQGEGAYSFVNLPIGTYRLAVSKQGFETSALDNVRVQAGRVTDVSVTLKVGATDVVVEIHEEAAPIIETTSNAIATTIDMKQIEDLPLQGRDISSLAFLTPGYAGTPDGGTWNGLPVIAQSNTIDGVVSSTSRMKFAGNAQPGLEARLEDIQEMTVQSSQVDLSQGLGMAAMQVNFVTRRGSNDFHGRVFEDFRNTVLNANSWSNNAIGLPRNPLILNEFGGGVGGRIIRDKLFFFGSFAMSKQPGGYVASSTVLTPLAQQGIVTLSDGSTVNLFSQVAQPNGLPDCSTNPNLNGCAAFTAQQTLINKAIATPGTAVTASTDPNVLNVNWLVSSPITKYYPAFRVDYNATQAVRLDFSFENTKVNQPGAAAPLFPGSDFSNQAASNKSNNYTGSFGISWTITPTLVNQFRGGYYYNAFSYAIGASPTWNTQPQVSWALANSGTGFNLPVTTYYPIVNASDNATWSHRNHTLSFGFSFYREQDHYWNPPDGIPNYSLGLVNGDPAFGAFENYFAGASEFDRGDAEALYATLVGRISGVAPIGSGFPYDAKTGQYATTAGSAYNLDELQKGWGLYGQDSFRLTPRLTLNYGLRWDFIGDNHDLTSAYHGASIESMYGPSGVGNLFQPGTVPGITDPTYDASAHQYHPWNKTPQPSIGIAWNPNRTEGFLGKLLGGDNTVIRAGFDIKRFTEPYQYFWNNASNHGLAFFQYFSLQAANGGGTGTFQPGSLSVGDSLPSYAFSPAAYATSIPQSTYTWSYYFGGSGIDPHIAQPYLQEWNLGIQRQLGRSNVLEVRYMGHRSVHQWVSIDTNEVNVLENGFIDQFKAAQKNLAINQSHGINSFANNGYAGQQGLPIFDAAFAGESSGGTGIPLADYGNSSFIKDLNNGAVGSLANVLSHPFGTVPYVCNLVGSSLSPCADQYGYSSPGAYPVNFFQANPLADGYGFTLYGDQAAKASYLGAAGYGNYHALQVDFRQKQWHGMQFDANYTWSHTLGVQPDNQWTGVVNVFSARNLGQSYGPTAFDLRHVIHASGTFDLPFGSGKQFLNRKGVVDKVLGGWTLGTIFTYQTGLPFQLGGGYGTFNDYGDGGFTLSGITKSQLQSAVGVYHSSSAYSYDINPSLLSASSGTCSSYLTGVCQNTTPGAFGQNLWLYGPHLWNDDLSIAKVVPISERVKFSLQAQMLNVFNHPNWANPSSGPSYIGSTRISSSAFGTAGLSNMNGPRLVEFRANISF
jgi:hypothetical protein